MSPGTEIDVEAKLGVESTLRNWGGDAERQKKKGLAGTDGSWNSGIIGVQKSTCSVDITP